ncbi:MAG: ankyrin repeat domain-containing protein, partial [Actinobacteria bacterium]|nr:ankyrin repeat domain-containing protein [Actinomycetota bacterium]
MDKGAEINATDKQGESPLFLACKKRNTKGVQILLSRGAARYINDKNNDGWTPLFIACIMGNAEIVTLLLLQ